MPAISNDECVHSVSTRQNRIRYELRDLSRRNSKKPRND
jgi:hypothetical protein